MLSIAQYAHAEYVDGTQVPVCMTAVESAWPIAFFAISIGLFFVAPLAILIVLYTVIAKHLMDNPGITSHGNRSNVLRYRKQVILMLGAVVASFFLCLAPFRALTIWIIVVPAENIVALGIDSYYSLLYFCRIMLYLNSALNPILYNLMSSKFREGFLRLLCCRSRTAGSKLKTGTGRMGTFNTTSTNLSSSLSGGGQQDRQRSKNGSGGAGGDPMIVRRYRMTAAGQQQVMSSTGGETSDSDVPPDRPESTIGIARRARKQQFADIVENISPYRTDGDALSGNVENNDDNGNANGLTDILAARSRRPSTTYILQYAKSLKPTRLSHSARPGGWKMRRAQAVDECDDDADGTTNGPPPEFATDTDNEENRPETLARVQVHEVDGDDVQETPNRLDIHCRDQMNEIIQCGGLVNGNAASRQQNDGNADGDDGVEDKECSRFLHGHRCHFESLV